MKTTVAAESWVRRVTLTCAAASSIALIAGCSSGQRTEEPQAMTPASTPTSAEEERAQARRHEQMADQAGSKEREPGKKGALERDQLRRKEQKHREHAREHERLAAELERFEASECRSVSTEQRASCPLMGPIAGITNVSGGVHLTLSEGADTDQVLAQMRCHAAFARARGYKGMESCPLYHPGVDISKGADGRSIDLMSSDPTVAGQLQHEAELHFGR